MSPRQAQSRAGGFDSVQRAEYTAPVVERTRAGAQRLGAAPACIELSQVPQRIVSEVPELRSYRYFAIGEEIAIVEPKSRRIVEIIE